ncbi:MAG: tRNA ((37)-N6)-threonylcarbamoyltransferase complex dimerization subunit type 1 TsaB [Pseudomonadota bacterium]|jgi:tRNA threonylcarbamoyladenosine biosynthesis protein TsaB
MTSESAQPCESGRSPTVLAIDTTAGMCSVAVLGPRGVARRAEPMTRGHSRHVLGLVEAVLADTSTPAAAVDAIGFGSGPGSFTGLRIACGVAQGLGFGWGRPLVPVDAMRTLGRQAAPGATHEAVWVALDLRMGEVCVAVFAPGALDAPWPEPRLGPLLVRPEAALAAFAADGARAPLLAGDGWDVHPSLREGAPRDAVRAAGAVHPDAAAVAALAVAGLAAGHAVPAERAAPTYLRDKVALDVDEQAALRAARGAVAAE